jgi:hypothetical protein
MNLTRLNEISKPDRTWKRQAAYRAANRKKLREEAEAILIALRRKSDESD